MLRIDNLTYAIEGRPLFEGASAFIPAGHKVGLVGRNGAGKTTLFRLIQKELQTDAGAISLPQSAKIGGVAQEAPASDASLIETVLAADDERARLLAEAEIATDPARIADIQTRLADISAWSAEARAASILNGMGFDHAKQAMPCHAFSGGWRMRVALAGVLFSAPDLLLLDEPTNYLDLEGALWLEAYLARYPHTVLLISHDRALLNRSVGAILHLENRGLTFYRGPYDTFARERAQRRAQQAAAAAKQEARRQHLQAFVDRFRAKATKARQAQSRVKMLERMETIRAPEDEARTRFQFPEPDELAPPLVATEDAVAGYGETVVLRNLNLRIDQDDRIAVLGQNGEGKSTLAKLLSGRLKPMGGKITASRKLRVGYFAQHQVDELDTGASPIAHLARELPEAGETAWRARLAGFGIGAEAAETPAGKLSGGQKARLSLLLSTLEAPHILILDEPTNHLDIESREGLVEALTAYSGAVILISHDMHLLSLAADRLWLAGSGTVRPYEDDLETYRASLLQRRGADAAKQPKSQSRSQVKPQTNAPHKPSKDKLAALRQSAREWEERVRKLTDAKESIAARLADPNFFAKAGPEKLEAAHRRFAEVEAALEQAEARWLDAMEKIEQAA